MKVNEIFTERDVEKYIGESKSWKKAWWASKRKWELEKQGKCYSDLCGFCFVLLNRGKKCKDCPVCKGCAPGNSPDIYLAYLRRVKKRIFAL